MNTEEQIEAAKMMEKHEIALSYLYETYGKKIPGHASLWSKLSMEERSHSFMINTFRGMLEEGTLEVGGRSFKTEEVQASMEKLNDHMNYARRNDITAREALEAALELEGGILENRIFEVREGDPEDLRRVLSAIAEQTRGHYTRIKKRLEELGE